MNSQSFKESNVGPRLPALPIDTAIRLFGLRLENQTLHWTARSLGAINENSSQKAIAFINADCVNKLCSPSGVEYRRALDGFDQLYADGVGMRVAAKLQGQEFVDNVNGTDLFPMLAKELHLRRRRVFLLGGKPGVAEKLTRYLEINFPDLIVAGHHHGFLTGESSEKVVDKINRSSSDVVLVAMGAPTQEIWINEYKSKMTCRLLIGVGGLFDFYSGDVSRAPLWLRKLSLEWVWRLLVQPKHKAKRYLIGNPVFLFRAWCNARQKKPKIGFLQQLLKVQWQARIYATAYIQRCIAVLLASTMLFLLSPLMLIIAFLIKQESPGAAIFRQTRVGKHGRQFSIYKFRSMFVDAEERLSEYKDDNESKEKIIFKLKDDPRVTRVGRFIRRSSIDELPQLVNVLLGTMSLVGPRPPLPGEVALYDSPQNYRLQCTPGITGIWQVSGRSNLPFKQQLEMDIDYILRKSILTDIAILIRTVPAVLFARGAY